MKHGLSDAEVGGGAEGGRKTAGKGGRGQVLEATIKHSACVKRGRPVINRSGSAGLRGGALSGRVPGGKPATCGRTEDLMG